MENIEDMSREQIKQIAKEKGLWWSITAMVDGSIGYHSPKSAEIRIKALLEDREIPLCERSCAIFECDGLKEIKYDFRCFLIEEKRRPERVKRLIEITKKVSQFSDIGQTAFGLMYPTSNL